MLFLVTFIPLFAYGIYVLPVFLEYGGGGCLVDKRKDGYHADYLWGLITFVKWKDTVLCGIDPPLMVLGNQSYSTYEGHPKPIPLPGQWQVSRTVVSTSYWKVKLYYVAYTNKEMYHTRIGWRWDDLDDFFLFSIVPAKKLPYNWERVLWLHELRSWQRSNG